MVSVASLNGPGSARFLPPRVVGHRPNGNVFLLDQFLRGELGWQWRRHRLAGVAGEFIGKLVDETLGGPRARFAERADGPPGDVVADRLQSARVFGDAAA